jgi:spermidine synthase
VPSKSLSSKDFYAKYSMIRTYGTVVAGRGRPALHKVTTPIGKGRGNGPRPSFYALSLLYQFLPTYTDKFCHFIFHANSSAYGENRWNGGLT